MSATHATVAFLVRLVTGAKPVTQEGGTAVELPHPCVLYANHSSHLDFLTLWALLPGDERRRVRPVAAADYWGSGWKAAAAQRLFNPLLVERGKGGPAQPRRPGGQVDRLCEALDAGDSLAIFPEGTRGDGERIADFQAGIARIAAARPDVPIIPVALANVGRILPKGSVVPVPVLVSATFLPPVVRGADEAEAGYLARARQALVDALQEK
ncbi:lysophospholipid acyltransferase family protein [Mariniluteicoccus endophyticus]